MTQISLVPTVVRCLAGAFFILTAQLWLLGTLPWGPSVACLCLYWSLLLIGRLGATTLVLPLFLIPVWWMHYVPAPQLAKNELVDYWFCRVYLSDLNWEQNYHLTCWSLLPLTLGLILPLCIPGFLTERQIREGSESGMKKLTLTPVFESFCLFWLIGCIGVNITGIDGYMGGLSQPMKLLLETRIVALGTLLLLGKPRMAILAGGIGMFYELLLAATSGLFAGLFDRVLPVIFLVLFRLRWQWRSMLAVLGFFAALYINEVEKQTVYRVQLQRGHLSGPVETVLFLTHTWYELVTNPSQLVEMQTRSNFFQRMDNQFYIQNALMSRIPTEVPHYYGQRLRGVVENFIPRVIYPNKPLLLDRKEFLYLTGHPLESGTSMGYGPTGELYIDFGLFGMFGGMFVYGLLFGFAWRFFHIRADENPAWWPWFCYLFGMWVTQIGAMMVMITGRTVKGAVILLVLYFFVPRIRDLLYLPSRHRDRTNDEFTPVSSIRTVST